MKKKIAKLYLFYDFIYIKNLHPSANMYTQPHIQNPEGNAFHHYNANHRKQNGRGAFKFYYKIFISLNILQCSFINILLLKEKTQIFNSEDYCVSTTTTKCSFLKCVTVTELDLDK